MWEVYYQASNIQEAIELVDKHQTNAKIIAGGTDLWLEMKQGLHSEVEALIDISRIDGADEIYEDGEGWIHLGPLVTHSHCVKSELIRKYAFCLYQACASVGSPQIRNRGTVAGNVFTASPANDSISALMVLNAIIVVKSLKGIREIPISNLFAGVRKPKIEKNEIITDIKIKKLHREESTSFFFKLGLRKAQAISLLNLSVVAITDSENRIVDLRIALGSVAPTVIRANVAESYAKGKRWNELDLDILGNLAADATSPINDLRSTAEYRKDMVKILIKRSVKDYLIDRSPLSQPKNVSLWGTEKRNFKPLQHNQATSNNSEIELLINGKRINAKIRHGKTLLDLIRDLANQKGTKEGCGEGECGACTVFMDGIAVLACLIPVERALHSEIVTIEGLSSDDGISKLQKSFITEDAVQCGFCTPGFIMSATKLLEEINHPAREEIMTAISGNLCRCTGYYKILTAIEKAAE